uniref:LL-diaminopimelate aminotransferase n=1 Tax=Tetraselmis sp. GSL018 TaxID=582737 RepID=A0A061S1T7_9CHLO
MVLSVSKTCLTGSATVCARPTRRPVQVSAVAAPEQATTQVKRNENFGKLQAGYLFPEIARRRNDHQKKYPDAQVISLGIGDTTEPIPDVIADALAKASKGLATREGYSGYGPEKGNPTLQEAIQKSFYDGLCKPEEVFVSDGSKCDISRLQLLFGPGKTVAVQDPSYPAYVDSSVMMGQTGNYNGTGFDNIEYMLCNVDNGFFPDLSKTGRTDLIFFCSPNNPTGAAATREQLTELVAFAKKNGSIIIYDAAYSLFITDENCPRTIYEIPGADEVAIETCSFSKYAGFTGVRLGWTVVPEKLTFADGHPVIKDWTRVMSTCFNGASNIVQQGGLACLTPEGREAMDKLVAFYMENARILKDCFKKLGFEVYGGSNAPYVWVGFPGQASWDVFAEILEKCHLVTTPGSGFGPGGEGFVRASAFCQRENVLEAVRRLEEQFGK